MHRAVLPWSEWKKKYSLLLHSFCLSIFVDKKSFLVSTQLRQLKSSLVASLLLLAYDFFFFFRFRMIFSNHGVVRRVFWVFFVQLWINISVFVSLVLIEVLSLFSLLFFTFRLFVFHFACFSFDDNEPVFRAKVFRLSFFFKYSIKYAKVLYIFFFGQYSFDRESGSCTVNEFQLQTHTHIHIYIYNFVYSVFLSKFAY